MTSYNKKLSYVNISEHELHLKNMMIRQYIS